MSALKIEAFHLKALANVATKEQDNAIGHSGEVSRYGIPVDLWNHFLSAFPAMAAQPHDANLSKMVAFEIWSRRLEDFQKVQNRDPSLRELYLLWDCPLKVKHPKPRAAYRASVFVDLLS